MMAAANCFQSLSTTQHFFPTTRLLVISVLLLSSNMIPSSSSSSSAQSSSSSFGMVREELMGLLEVVGELLDDPSWVELHPHPCADTPWPGIQCEITVPSDPSTLHVTKFHIGPDIVGSTSSPCKPSATLSSSLLRRLPYLKTLSLFGCFIHNNNNMTTTIPSQLFTNLSSSTSRLEQLVLNSNPGLTGEIPDTIAELGPHLRVLSLSENNLSGFIPSAIGRLSKLQQLDLSYNRFTGPIPSSLGDVGASLSILDLSHNQLQGPIPSTIVGLTSLEKIDVSCNMLSGKIPVEMAGHHHHHLVLVDMSHNQITGPMLPFVGLKESLEYLMLEENPMNTTIPESIGQMRNLSVLGMSGCGLYGPIPESMGGMSGLTALALDRNRLSGRVPVGLGELPKLRQMNLSQNQLSGELDFTEEFVRRLGKRLDVRDNNGLCAASAAAAATNGRPQEYYVPACSSSSSTSSGDQNHNMANNNGTSKEEHGTVTTSNSYVAWRRASCTCWIMASLFASVRFI